MKKLSILLIGIALLAISCRDTFHMGIRGNGNIVTEERSVLSFDEIKSSGSFNVFITNDSINSIVIEAEENLIPYINTNINGNKLTLKKQNNRNLRNTEPINIYVRTNSISHVSLSGSGYINIENVNTSFFELDISGSGGVDCEADANYIDADISGSGELTLTGSADKTELHISGSGKINSYNLEQNTCFAKISGSGNIYANVLELLDVRISGSGSVHYIGFPAINTSISGSGNVISHN